MHLAQIFRPFDLRGAYPLEINERVAFVLGRSLAKYKKPKRVLVASDTRPSSPVLRKYLADGLASSGCEVFDALEVSIPQFYFTMATAHYDLGVMITASHLSQQDNGFKFADRDGLPFDQEEVLDLKKIVSQNTNVDIVIPRQKAQIVNSTDKYVREICDHFQEVKFTSKIVVDLAESSVSTAVMTIFKNLNVDFDIVRTPDVPNPLLTPSRKHLKLAVKAKKADLGIMWDSDGDRVVFVDSEGDLIPPSFVLAFMATRVLKESPHRTIAVDARSGLIVAQKVKEAQGKIAILPSWVQYLKFAAREDPSIVFAGETSGHMMFTQFHAIDDGIFAALKFLQFYQDGGEEVIQSYRKDYFEIPETNFDCPTALSVDVLEQLTQEYRQKADTEIHVLDGLTVIGTNYKFNLRSSLTEPVLRLNIEAKSESQAAKILETVQKKIENYANL